MPDFAHGAANAHQFGFGRRGPGDKFAINRFMQHRAGCGKAQSPCAQAFLHQPRHFGDVGFGWLLIIRAALSHDKGAQRAVRNLRADIDGARQAFERIEIIGKAFPIPFHPLGERSARNILDTLHQADQPIMLVLFRGRKANAAIAHDNRGDAMPARRTHLAVPRCLAVIMGMDVDKPRRDDFARSINLFATRSADLAHSGNDAAIHRDIGDKARRARAINDRSTTNDQIMHIDSPLPKGEPIRLNRTVKVGSR